MIGTPGKYLSVGDTVEWLPSFHSSSPKFFVIGFQIIHPRTILLRNKRYSTQTDYDDLVFTRAVLFEKVNKIFSKNYKYPHLDTLLG